MFKFIHCADIHLDSPLKGLDRYEGAPVAEIRRSTRDALANLVDLATEEKVSFLAIAGDLYDGDWHDHGTGLYFNQQMARLRDEGIDVFMIRGNHDAASQISRHLKMPDNVKMLATDKPETILDDKRGVAIHGQGFASRAEVRNLAETYPNAQPGFFNLGLLHTCATGREGHETYAPCTIDDMVRRGYQYWALGHIHKREVLHSDPPIMFSGNIQGRHARELGSKGCTLVTVEGGRASKWEHRPLDVLRWEMAKVDADGARDLDDIVQRVSNRLAALRDEAEDRVLAVRVEISGSCPAHQEIAGEQGRIEAEIRDRARDIGGGSIWIEKLKLRTTRPVRFDMGDGPIGVLLQLIEELKSDDDRLRSMATNELADLRRKLPDELRRGDEPLDLDSPAALRDALDHVEPMIIRGLLNS
ncbi:metallophosphoesterase family protein [Singulisphaera sp. PoT]|uniref:metallophosphoesterase family protein n=1 Tax=Singulisphaera sp. PoT TaxID=3411797 RepID=UPI003BF4C71E